MKCQSLELKACIRLESEYEVFETSGGVIEAASLGEGPTVLISHGEGGGYHMGITTPNTVMVWS